MLTFALLALVQVPAPAQAPATPLAASPVARLEIAPGPAIR